MTNNDLKILAFDLIRHYYRNFENCDSNEEKAKYTEGVIDLYTEILKEEQNDQYKRSAV